MRERDEGDKKKEEIKTGKKSNKEWEKLKGTKRRKQ